MYIYMCVCVSVWEVGECGCKFSLSLRCLVSPVHLSHVLITCRLFMLHAFHSFYVKVLVSVPPDASNYWNEDNLFALSPAIIFTAVQAGTDVILRNPFRCYTVTFPFCNMFRIICVSPFHHFAGHCVLHPLFSHTITSNSTIYPKQVGIFGD
jgi:hypothetical protein